TAEALETTVQKFFSLRLRQFRKGNFEIANAGASQVSRQKVSKARDGQAHGQRRPARQDAQPGEKSSCECVLERRLKFSWFGHESAMLMSPKSNVQSPTSGNSLGRGLTQILRE